MRLLSNVGLQKPEKSSLADIEASAEAIPEKDVVEVLPSSETKSDAEAPAAKVPTGKEFVAKACHKRILLAVSVLAVVSIVLLRHYQPWFVDPTDDKSLFDHAFFSLTRMSCFFLIFAPYVRWNPNGYVSSRRLMNRAGWFFTSLHFSCLCGRIYTEYRDLRLLNPYSIPIAAALFIVVTAFQIYVSLVDFYDFFPCWYKPYLRKMVCIDRLENIAIVSSGAMEIILRNDGDEAWVGLGHKIKRRTFFKPRGWKKDLGIDALNEDCVTFKLPENTILWRGDRIKLIPESEPAEIGCKRIRGLRCFGYDIAHECLTQLIDHNGECISDKWEKNIVDGYENGKRHFRDDAKRKKIWQHSRTSAYGPDGELVEHIDVGYPMELYPAHFMLHPEIVDNYKKRTLQKKK